MRGFLFVIGACCFWAFDSLIRYPLLGEGVSAFNIVLIEHFILSFIFAYSFLKNFNQIASKDLLAFLFIGGIGSALATLSFTRAFEYMNPSLVILLQKLQPIVAISLARILLKEKIQAKFLLWAFVCMLGGILIGFEDFYPLWTGRNQWQQFFFKSDIVRGYILVGIAVVGWGASTVLGRKLSLEKYSEKSIMGGRSLFGFLCLLPFMFSSGYSFQVNAFQVTKIVLMAIFSGAVALYLFYKGLKLISARSCAIAEMFFPLFAIIVNWVFLGKALSFTQILGGSVLILGATMIQLKDY